MGKLVWSDWGRLLAITSASYMLWGSFWAFFFRKHFWDFIGGTLGPAGIIPGANTRLFVTLIVDIPLFQIFTTLLSFGTLVLELPFPGVGSTALHRSLILRVVMYFITALVGIMVYQTFDCAVYYFITCLVFARALLLGERIGGGGGGYGDRDRNREGASKA